VPDLWSLVDDSEDLEQNSAKYCFNLFAISHEYRGLGCDEDLRGLQERLFRQREDCEDHHINSLSSILSAQKWAMNADTEVRAGYSLTVDGIVSLELPVDEFLKVFSALEATVIIKAVLSVLAWVGEQRFAGVLGGLFIQLCMINQTLAEGEERLLRQALLICLIHAIFCWRMYVWNMHVVKHMILVLYYIPMTP